MTQSGLQITVGALVMASVLLGCVGYLLVKWLDLLHVWSALAAAPLVRSIPFMFVRWKRTRRFGKFEEQFPEAIELMARALRADMHSRPASQMVAERSPIRLARSSSWSTTGRTSACRSATR